MSALESTQPYGWIHTRLEIVHGQYAGEDTLVVAIKKSTDTGKASDTKDSEVFDQGHWTRGAHEGFTAVKGDIVCARGGSSRCHIDFSVKQMLRKAFELSVYRRRLSRKRVAMKRRSIVMKVGLVRIYARSGMR